MRFEVDRGAFASLLADAAATTSKYLPITDCVLLEADPDKSEVRLTATDLERTVRMAVPATGVAEGSAAVNAARLRSVVGSLSADSVAVEKDDPWVRLKAARWRGKLAALPTEDYPAVGEVEGGVEAAVPEAALARAMGVVEHAMANGDVRHYLNGMLFEVEGTALRVVASDGHRLGVSRVELPEAPGDGRWIVPRTAARQLRGLLSTDDSATEFLARFAEGAAVFKVGGRELATKLVDGEYPKFGDILPEVGGSEFRLSREAVAASAARVATVLEQEKFGVVSIGSGEGELSLSVDAREAGSAEDAVSVSGALDEGLGVNARYLREALAALDSDEVGVWTDGKLLNLAPDENTRLTVMAIRS